VRKIHEGGYHARAKWACKKRLRAPTKPERAAASAKLATIRDANGGSYPHPVPLEVKDLQAIVFASTTWTIGIVVSICGIAMFEVAGRQ
jgi:hypothetical protein